MCGIVGYHSLKQDISDDIIDKMVDIISYRGPDDRGVFHENSVALGHRRLSIIELSKAGHQPFHYIDRYIIVFNGEIYNYIELRNQLISKGYLFHTQTDTEVLVAMYDHYGEECVSFLNGMWSFCIFDQKKNTFFCSRDRFGIKPFYFWYDNFTFIFASEIKQLLLVPEVIPKVNRDRLLDFLICGEQDYTEETMFQNILQLRGGQNAFYDLRSGKLRIKSYYSLADIRQSRISYHKACSNFKDIFAHSIKLRLRADVPVGYCLSGGLDSSAIVCMADHIIKQEKLDLEQHTISSCFEDKEYDEQEYIDEVVKRTTVNAHKIFSDEGNLFDQIDDIIWHMDEPFGSTSIYAQWNVFKESQKYGMKVMLDGQGADEQLAGYTPFYGISYTYYLKRFRFIQFYKEISGYMNLRQSTEYNIKKKKMIIDALAGAYYPKKVMNFLKKQSRNSSAKDTPFDTDMVKSVLNRKEQRYPINNPKRYILDSIYGNMSALLHFEDRDSMAHSIESRVPFLDYKLVEYVYTLPFSYKLKNGVTKRILRDGLDGILPDKIKNRYSKLGFVTPEDKWINENAEKYEKELLEACDILSPLIDKTKVAQWFEKKKGKILRGDSTVWRIICAAHWIKIFQVEM